MKVKWWVDDVVYQIYPRSFADSNGDGIGDLEGIRRRIPYIASLGVDIVWLNPIYRSPNKDNGYDVSDYYNIMEEFGSIEDVDRLIAEFHEHGIRVVMDLVVNHCSSDHEWFRSASASENSPYRDYFIWKKSRDGGAPNNWASFFGGPAWERVGDEYYLHLFHKGQPDLNWENPKLRQDVYRMMRFWLDKGVDGFRMDAITMISKDPSYRDLQPGESPYSTGAPYLNGPRLTEFLREMEQEVFSHYDACKFGECPGVVLENSLTYLGGENPLFDLLFMSDIVDQDRLPTNKFKKLPFDLEKFTNSIALWQNHLHGRGGNAFYLMNHDQPRSVSRFGSDDAFRVESARALMMLLLSLEGTPFIYQGEELGMTNAHFADIGMYRDVETLNYYDACLAEGRDPREVMDEIQQMSRDNSRTPMQWSAGKNAGFSESTPWIAVGGNFRSINAEAAEKDPRSVLAFTRRMVAFRKEHAVLRHGDYSVVDGQPGSVFSYIRSWQGERMRIILNFSDSNVPIKRIDGELLLSTHSFATGDDLGENELRAWEGRIVALSRGRG